MEKIFFASTLKKLYKISMPIFIDIYYNTIFYNWASFI